MDHLPCTYYFAHICVYTCIGTWYYGRIPNHIHRLTYVGARTRKCICLGSTSSVRKQKKMCECTHAHIPMYVCVCVCVCVYITQPFEVQKALRACTCVCAYVYEHTQCVHLTDTQIVKTTHAFEFANLSGMHVCEYIYRKSRYIRAWCSSRIHSHARSSACTYVLVNVWIVWRISFMCILIARNTHAYTHLPTHSFVRVCVLPHVRASANGSMRTCARLATRGYVYTRQCPCLVHERAQMSTYTCRRIGRTLCMRLRTLGAPIHAALYVCMSMKVCWRMCIYGRAHTYTVIRRSPTIRYSHSAIRWWCTSCFEHMCVHVCAHAYTHTQKWKHGSA